jgi:hypothetical protein
VKIYLFLSLGLLLLLTTACVNTTSLQSGRTLGKGEGESIISFAEGAWSSNSQGFEDGSLNYIPMAEVGANYGVAENLDLAFRVNSAAFLSGQIKYQISSNKESFFATSIGCDVGFSAFYLFAHTAQYRVSVPLYLSIHPSEELCIFLTPRYTISSTYNFAQKTSSDWEPPQNLNYAAISYGIMIGSTSKFVFEFTHSSGNILPNQFAFGFKRTFTLKKRYR